jgi:hypothetical protein
MKNKGLNPDTVKKKIESWYGKILTCQVENWTDDISSSELEMTGHPYWYFWQQKKNNIEDQNGLHVIDWGPATGTHHAFLARHSQDLQKSGT